MNQVKDWNADYIDGSHGGTKSIPWNLSANERKAVGYERGIDYAKYFLFAYKNGDGSFKESIKVITHSMGAAYAKGFIQGLIDGGVPINMLEFEADFAPFQPTKQEAVKGVRTLQYSHSEDWIARNEKMKGAEYEDTSSDKNQTHSIADFMNQIQNLPEGKYKFENGKIVFY